MRQRHKMSAPATHRGSTRFSLACFLLSVIALLFLATCYAVRPDACAAVTILPVWAWGLPALGLIALGWRRRALSRNLVHTALWVAFFLLFTAEVHSLGRGVLRPAPGRMPPAQSLRVVSLNCAGGSAPAAAELCAFHPDLVLLQESPYEKAVRALASRLYGTQGAWVWGPDASIVARGRLIARHIPRARTDFVEARLILPSGQAVEVISLRLSPPVFRADLWSPDCWREQYADRRARREELAGIIAFAEPYTRDVPVILGGDCNTPAGDAVFRLLRPRLSDTFARAGVGWGNTVTDDYPFARIDQIWATADWQAATVYAQWVRHSDHRAVICDLRRK